MASRHLLDPATESAALVFLERAAKLFPIKDALVFGSRARGNYRPDSDADLAILMAGSSGDFSMTILCCARVQTTAIAQSAPKPPSR